MPEHIVKKAFVHREGGKTTLYEATEKKQPLSAAAAEHAAARGYIDVPKAKAEVPAKPTQPDGQANA
ncbi:hypothetical protein PHLH8_08090 [Pseudomonas sp. Pc102]|uniref:hypothetical protein n=1 Tax=Pseudomonas sp. Pc102 TaxID=2678261 RepID=UPI001BD08F18|nr:hypothetical protein [Pseudomonas sp. Pc102]BBP81167.1 hypothetical protein PHLH8_08090 [Pseudomonas sp. Pc102]